MCCKVHTRQKESARISKWTFDGCGGRLRLKCDGTRAETRFRLSAKRTSPFNSAGTSVQSATGSRGVRISISNAAYTMFRGSVGVLATHSIRQFPLHFPSRASPCAITFQLDSTIGAVELHLSGSWLSVSPIIRMGLALWTILSRNLQN